MELDEWYALVHVDGGMRSGLVWRTQASIAAPRPSGVLWRRCHLHRVRCPT